MRVYVIVPLRNKYRGRLTRNFGATCVMFNPLERAEISPEQSRHMHTSSIHSSSSFQLNILFIFFLKIIHLHFVLLSMALILRLPSFEHTPVLTATRDNHWDASESLTDHFALFVRAIHCMLFHRCCWATWNSEFPAFSLLLITDESFYRNSDQISAVFHNLLGTVRTAA